VIVVYGPQPDIDIRFRWIGGAACRSTTPSPLAREPAYRLISSIAGLGSSLRQPFLGRKYPAG